MPEPGGPDFMAELEHFTTPGLTMDPLPAAEVRRRGTRMRRRHHALAALGGAAAVAIIATPLAMAASHDRTDSTPPPATRTPSPSVTWVQQIPADLPLADGLPQATTRDSYRRQDDGGCDAMAWSPQAAPRPVAVEQAVQAESEGGWDRTIAVYADADTALATRQGLERRVRECAAATVGETRSTAVVGSTPDSFGYVDHVGDAGEIYVHRMVQVGNALLLDTAYSLGGGDPAVVRRAAGLIETKSAPVVDAMCVFSAEPC